MQLQVSKESIFSFFFEQCNQALALFLSPCLEIRKHIDTRHESQCPVHIGSQQRPQSPQPARDKRSRKGDKFFCPYLRRHRKPCQRKFGMGRQNYYVTLSCDCKFLTADESQRKIILSRFRPQDDGGAQFGCGQIGKRKMNQYDITASQRSGRKGRRKHYTGSPLAAS